MKLAMVMLSEKLKNEGLSARLLLQVHDELVLECSNDELKKTAQVVCQEMETAYKLKIPLITEARYGPNWGTMTVLQMG
jgi:DNA polymerase-1